MADSTPTSHDPSNDAAYKEVVPTLIQIDHRSPEAEACGFIIKDERGPAVIPVPNVHPDPNHNFLMDYTSQMHALESHGERVIGMYHTHPLTKEPNPSEEDIGVMGKLKAYLAENMLDFLLVADDQVWNWRLEEDGDLFGYRIA